MKPRKVELGEDGQALVEFALTFPLLLTMITLIMQFALAFNGTALVRYAAYNVARSAAVYLPLNNNDGGDSTVQSKARMAAAISLAPVSPPLLGDLFPVELPGGIPGLNLANRFAYAYGTLALLDGITIQRKSDFESGSGGNSDNFQLREPVYAKVDYYFALMIPPADQVLWYLGGGSWDPGSLLLKALSGGSVKALKMSGKAAFIHAGKDGVER